MPTVGIGESSHSNCSIRADLEEKREPRWLDARRATRVDLHEPQFRPTSLLGRS
jgi:hypothetical protein